MSRILEKYDNSAFEITPNFLVVSFMFSEPVNEVINEVINDVINEKEKLVAKQKILWKLLIESLKSFESLILLKESAQIKQSLDSEVRGE